MAMGSPGAGSSVGRGAAAARYSQAPDRNLDRGTAASGNADRLHRSVHSAAAAQISRSLVPGASQLGGRNRDTGCGETFGARRYCFHLRSDAAEVAAACLVSAVLWLDAVGTGARAR